MSLEPKTINLWRASVIVSHTVEVHDGDNIEVLIIHQTLDSGRTGVVIEQRISEVFNDLWAT